MRDFGAREDRARDPVRGLRQRLRVALRAAGVTAKFRTDHLRTGDLVVMAHEPLTLPFSQFEGRTVKIVNIHGHQS